MKTRCFLCCAVSVVLCVMLSACSNSPSDGNVLSSSGESGAIDIVKNSETPATLIVNSGDQPVSILSKQSRTEVCHHGGRIDISSRYFLLNNLWRWGGDYNMNPALSWCCVWYEPSNGHWGISYCVVSGTASGIKAYPAMVSGCRWGTCSGESDFPRQVNQDLYVSYVINNVTHGTTYPTLKNVYNIVFELWIDPGPTMSGDIYDVEMMIWLRGEGLDDFAGDPVNNNGETWYYKNMGAEGRYFVSFFPSKQIDGVSNLNVKPFADHLVSVGVMQSSYYYHDIEAGSEMVCGEVDIEFSHFYCGASPDPNPPEITSLKSRW